MNISEEQLKSCLSKMMKDYRKENNLIQKQLAAKVGIKRSHVGSYEEKRALPRAGVLIKLLTTMGITHDTFLQKAQQNYQRI